MDDRTSEPIIIYKVSRADGAALLQCFFKQKANGKYDFYDKDGTEKAKDKKVGEHFKFQLDEDPGIEWHLSIGHGTHTKVSGDWLPGPGLSRDTDDPDPTYQAQAQGTKEEEDSAASATA